ncbi:MAG: hypothetical protein ACRCSB_04685 [Bacteroidales bacterium]
MDKVKTSTKSKTQNSSPKDPQKPRRLVVSYKNLSPELLDLLKQKYPHGWNDAVMKVNKNDNDFFYAVMQETIHTCYLIKVDVKIDSSVKEDDDAVLISSDDDTNSSELGENEDIEVDADKEL